MNHAELQSRILTLAFQLRLHVHHCDMRLATMPGWPDLVLVGIHGAIWRELKIPPDKPTSAQTEVGWMLRASGQDWAVWTPADWPEHIHRELEKIS